MVRILIPHVAVVAESNEITKSSLNDLIHHALDASATRPCALDIYDATTQRFLFARERQIYAAAEATGGQLSPTSIRDFLVGTTRLSFPRAALLELDTKVLHSVLVVAQKKPALRVMTNLVDLDELLNRIESEGKSSIVSAVRDSFFALLRYEKGKAVAFCHERMTTAPSEGSLRDEFLVKVYTHAATEPLTVSLYEDFLVSYAPDAKNVPPHFRGRFDDLFLSKPPVVVLRFKEREIGRWEMDRPRLRIGRTPDNDVVIDNLAVSRLHAVLEADKGAFFIKDCDSLNGTEVNGVRVAKRELKDGDEISIAKHTILFRIPTGHAVAEPDTAAAGFEQTMIFTRTNVTTGAGPVVIAPPRPAASNQAVDEGLRNSAVAVATRPRLVAHDQYGDRVIEIAESGIVLGSDESADVRIEGMFIAARHAQIVLEGGRVVLRRIGGLRPVKVGGKAVREVELKDRDEIQIANESFVFHE
jgi:pSer/pThr/pTyr-binding forkhead associated (FHA) protein